MVSLPPLKSVIAEFGLNAQKSLGQHFLLDSQLTDRIVRMVPNITSRKVVEIGPGPGGLTRSLLQAGVPHLFAIEMDGRCVKALEMLKDAFPGVFTLRHADALTIHIPEWCQATEDDPVTIVANLPYNVGTQLLLQWLETPHYFEQMVVMLQKEVADRILASPGGKVYGRLSILVQWLCDVRRCFDVRPEAFVPPPSVHSTVLSITPKRHPAAVADRMLLEKLTHTVFSMRRKTLKVSLKTLYADSEGLLKHCNIDPMRRPETLHVEEFITLANALHSILSSAL